MCFSVKLPLDHLKVLRVLYSVADFANLNALLLYKMRTKSQFNNIPMAKGSTKKGNLCVFIS